MFAGKAGAYPSEALFYNIGPWFRISSLIKFFSKFIFNDFCETTHKKNFMGATTFVRCVILPTGKKAFGKGKEGKLG